MTRTAAAGERCATNPVLDLLYAHGSSRNFLDRPVDDVAIDAIVRAAHQAPTSNNGQQVSLVVVRDADMRHRIADLAGRQPHVARAPVFIAIVIDFHKTAEALALHGVEQRFDQSVEGLITGSVDVGIQLATLTTAARSLGLGTVAIGGVRNDLSAINALLRLPARCTVIAGLCIGHVAAAAPVKPRLAIATYRHDEHYDPRALPPAITAYDRAIADHWTAVSRRGGTPWSDSLAGSYHAEQCPQSRDAFAAAGLFGHHVADHHHGEEIRDERS